MTRTLPVAAIDGETVDQLVWRTLRRAAPVVEQVLNLNPGLADQGCFLRHGQTVLVPADATRTAPVPMVQLWS
ncbi:tail protein X [Brevundimonas sp. BH3]|uniref:tail protein X n=1 Tax=Brevundimonas sp. BH3 TaxID=3133089 RepID=UPI003250554E